MGVAGDGILVDTDRDGQHFTSRMLVHASVEGRRKGGGDWAMTGAKIFSTAYDMTPAAAAVKIGEYRRRGSGYKAEELTSLQ